MLVEVHCVCLVLFHLLELAHYIEGNNLLLVTRAEVIGWLHVDVVQLGEAVLLAMLGGDRPLTVDGDLSVHTLHGARERHGGHIHLRVIAGGAVRGRYQLALEHAVLKGLVLLLTCNMRSRQKSGLLHTCVRLQCLLECAEISVFHRLAMYLW